MYAIEVGVLFKGHHVGGFVQGAKDVPDVGGLDPVVVIHEGDVLALGGVKKGVALGSYGAALVVPQIEVLDG